MVTVFASKMPIEPTSLFDDDIKELLYGWTKTYIGTMTYVKGATSYSGKDFDY